MTDVDDGYMLVDVDGFDLVSLQEDDPGVDIEHEALGNVAILGCVAQGLDRPQDLLQCAQVSKAWCEAVKSISVWENIYKLRNGVPQANELMPSYRQQCMRTAAVRRPAVSAAHHHHSIGALAISYDASTHNLITAILAPKDAKSNLTSNQAVQLRMMHMLPQQQQQQQQMHPHQHKQADLGHQAQGQSHADREHDQAGGDGDQGPFALGLGMRSKPAMKVLGSLQYGLPAASTGLQGPLPLAAAAGLVLVQERNTWSIQVWSQASAALIGVLQTPQGLRDALAIAVADTTPAPPPLSCSAVLGSCSPAPGFGGYSSAWGRCDTAVQATAVVMHQGGHVCVWTIKVQMQRRHMGAGCGDVDCGGAGGGMVVSEQLVEAKLQAHVAPHRPVHTISKFLPHAQIEVDASYGIAAFITHGRPGIEVISIAPGSEGQPLALLPCAHPTGLALHRGRVLAASRMQPPGLHDYQYHNTPCTTVVMAWPIGRWSECTRLVSRTEGSAKASDFVQAVWQTTALAATEDLILFSALARKTRPINSYEAWNIDSLPESDALSHAFVQYIEGGGEVSGRWGERLEHRAVHGVSSLDVSGLEQRFRSAVRHEVFQWVMQRVAARSARHAVALSQHEQELYVRMSAAVQSAFGGACLTAVAPHVRRMAAAVAATTGMTFGLAALELPAGVAANAGGDAAKGANSAVAGDMTAGAGAGAGASTCMAVPHQASRGQAQSQAPSPTSSTEVMITDKDGCQPTLQIVPDTGAEPLQVVVTPATLTVLTRRGDIIMYPIHIHTTGAPSP